MNTPVILTGAGSFLGKYVLKELDAEGIDTFAVSRKATTILARQGLSSRIKPVDLDLSAPELDWSPPLNSQYRIIHLAFDRMASGDSAHGAEINNSITRNIINLCRNANISAIVNASSTSVYGTPKGGLISAETAVQSPSDYGIAKLKAEQRLAKAAEVDSVLSVRLPAILGREAHPENWLVRIARAMQQHAEIAYQSPDFLFNNAVHGASIGAFFIELSQAASPQSAAFPVGAATGPTLRDLLMQMRDRLQSRSKLVVLPTTSAPFAIDNTAAESLGYKAEPIEHVIDRYLNDLTDRSL